MRRGVSYRLSFRGSIQKKTRAPPLSPRGPANKSPGAQLGRQPERTTAAGHRERVSAGSFLQARGGGVTGTRKRRGRKADGGYVQSATTLLEDFSRLLNCPADDISTGFDMACRRELCRADTGTGRERKRRDRGRKEKEGEGDLAALVENGLAREKWRCLLPLLVRICQSNRRIHARNTVGARLERD